MMTLKEIFKDNRGAIYIMEGELKEHQEITFFTTKKGFARGGVIHKSYDEYDTVLEGSIKYIIGEKEYVLQKGQSITVPKNTPHYFVALEDCVVAEWGCPPVEKTERHKAFRDIVDEINRKNNVE